jgi:hypothetical protein
MWSVLRCYTQGLSSVDRQFCTGVCEGMTWAREAEESPLSAVARERLAKTQQAGKGLEGAVVICELWRLAVALKWLINRVRHRHILVYCTYVCIIWATLNCQFFLPCTGKKGKALPVTGRGGPYGSETSRLPHFARQFGSQMVMRSALSAGLPLPPWRFLVLISVRGWVDLRAIVAAGRIRSIEKSNDFIRTAHMCGMFCIKSSYALIQIWHWSISSSAAVQPSIHLEFIMQNC